MAEYGEWKEYCWILKASQRVGALARWESFKKANLVSWTGMLMTHAVASNSRSWMLVSQAEDCVESVWIVVKWVIDNQGGMHLGHQWKVCPLVVLVDSVPVRGLNFQPCLFTCSCHVKFHIQDGVEVLKSAYWAWWYQSKAWSLSKLCLDICLPNAPFHHRGYRCCYSSLVRRCCSNLYRHMDRLVMFVCSSDASDGESSYELVASWGHKSSYN